jgi:two-component system response regulator DesR
MLALHRYGAIKTACDPARFRCLRADRERQILQRAGDGRSSTEIATELHLSEGTVRNYLSEVIAKLGASNRVDAARIARARGWL